MYHSWNLRRLLRYLALDTALVLAAILLTHLGKHHFPAVDSAGGVSLPVLMYHSVAPVPEQQYCVTPETLESDLRYLQAHGYETVSPEELVAYTNGNGTLPEKPVMLTFDDGLCCRFWRPMICALWSLWSEYSPTNTLPMRRTTMSIPISPGKT